jgi:hypothetical protein
MDTGISIKISYWVEGNDESLYDFEDIQNFREELNKHYVTNIHGRPADLGGFGINEFIIEVISNIDLTDVVKFLAEGIAFDLIKEGGKKFILKPFLEAYKTLKEKNKNNRLDIYNLKFSFSDTIVEIQRVTDAGISEELETILKSIAQHYNSLLLNGKEKPYSILIPLFKEPNPDQKIKYRKLFEVDEIIEDVTANDYYKYWGIFYDFSRKNMVYDVMKGTLLDEEFFTGDYYSSY